MTRQASPLDALDLRAEVVQNVQSLAPSALRVTEATDPNETLSLPDLQIFIRLSTAHGRSRLSFEVRARDSALGLSFREFGPIYLELEAKVFAYHLTKDLEQIANEDKTEISQSRLASLGTALFRSLPEDLQSLLWGLQGKIKDLQILSDEPYIPWEILKLGQRKLVGWTEGPFIAEAFAVTRWIRTIPQRALPMQLQRLALVSPGSSTLPSARLEREDLITLFAPDREVVDIEPTLLNVLDALRHSDYDGWHFIGHGSVTGEDANRATILLNDHQVLQPTDLLLSGESLSRFRPLVFLNTSGSGKGGVSLTGPGGWAPQFLESGAGAFLGSLWETRDSTSRAFSTAFYENFLRGVPLGEAFRRARLRVRDEFPGASDWLAYTAYAHPKVTCSQLPDRSLLLLPQVPELEWNPQASPPGALLRPEARVVPFHGRDREYTDLHNWCLSSPPVGIRLYTGPGGMGKTRLAIELALRMREEGWLSGFATFESLRSPQDTWRALARPEGKVLLIVDYAETNRPFLIPVLREMARLERGPVRLILLARAALDWWEQLKSERDGIGELLSGPATSRHLLRPLASSFKERENSYNLAAQAFSQRLQISPNTVPEDLDAHYFERVLLLHMKALMDLGERDNVTGENGVLDLALANERYYWRVLADTKGIASEVIPGIGRAMAAITLGGGVQGEKEAIEVLRGLQFFADQPTAVLVTVARLLRECYPGKKWIEPLQPDLLGEHLVQRELENGADELLDLVLGPPSRESSPGYRGGPILDARRPWDLSTTGWAVVFAPNLDRRVRHALDELLEYRRAQATRHGRPHYYKELTYQGESTADFLRRNGARPGMTADPNFLPYYLLLVGDPDVLPYRFQAELDVNYAVGRICFDRIENYATYARSTVMAETRNKPRPREVAFFGTAHKNDPSSHKASQELVQKLAESVRELRPAWKIQEVLGAPATKDKLRSLLGGPETPAFLFTACHGLGMDMDDPRQPACQGSLVCQDWIGPDDEEGVNEDQWFAASDVSDTASLQGLVAFFYSCYSLGTPQHDGFDKTSLGRPRQVAPKAFVSQLPQKLLSHKGGGMLAVIGHVDRSWTSSFEGSTQGEGLNAFRYTLQRLLQGHTVGWAMEYLNQSYASLAAMLGDLEERWRNHEDIDTDLFAHLWLLRNDARNFMVFGDPAVRLPGVGEPR